MEHLPLPSNPVSPPMKVPYLCQEDYDGGALLDYPERHGWTVNIGIYEMQITFLGIEPSNARISAFLQTWLYFGLLYETVGPRYRDVSFVEADGDAKYLTSINLEQVVGEWSLDLSSENSVKDLDSLIKRMRQAEENIVWVRKMVFAVGRCRPDVLHPNFALALAALGESLVQALRDVTTIKTIGVVMSESPILRRPWRKAYSEKTFDPGTSLMNLFRKNGWCPSDINRIDKIVEEIGTLYYMANLKPPRSGASHERCTEGFCSSTKINPLTYKLSHTRPLCKCRLVYADNDQLCNIIRHGGLAVLDIKTEEGNPRETEVTLRAQTQAEDFVALSHVWSEGLGNPFANALHACELTRISDLTRALHGKRIPIWVDSICVPVRPHHIKQLALGRMRQPYEQAKFVLVLDSYLSEIDASRIDGLEIFARILSSSWMQRLWTLQEGRLGKKVLFQFADKAIDLENVVSSMQRRQIPSKTYQSVQFNLVWSYEASHFRPEDRNHDKRDIITTRKSLKARSVSVASDEALCLACLMGNNVSQIAHAAPDDRMALFWKMQDAVPAGLVFSKAGRKLSIPGLTWAPESFFGFIPHPLHTDAWYGPDHLRNVKAPVTDNGLLVKLPGLMIHPNLQAIEARFDSKLVTGRSFVLDGTLYARDPRTGLCYVLTRENGPWNDKRNVSDDTGCHAIILDGPLESVSEAPQQLQNYRRTPDSLGFDIVKTFTGLEVIVDSKVLEENSQVVYVRGLRHVGFGLMSETWQRAFDVAWHCAKNMLAEKRLSSWIFNEDVFMKCIEKAKDLLKDPTMESLYRDQAIFEGAEFRAEKLAVDIAFYGTIIDLEFQPTAEDQLWCVS